MNEKTFERRLEIIFIVFLLILGIYYMILSFDTKMLGEDEEFYYSLAKIFANGNYPTILFDSPLSFATFTSLFSSLFFLISPSLGILKLTSTIFGFLTLFVVYLIGKKFNIYYGIFSAILLFSIQNFSHFMMIAYIEIPIAFFLYC